VKTENWRKGIPWYETPSWLANWPTWSKNTILRSKHFSRPSASSRLRRQQRPNPKSAITSKKTPSPTAPNEKRLP